jgi:broad specificity phosphatase PhoE
MIELLLIRHGQTDHNTEKRFQGHAPTRLNVAGRRQALRLAERLRRDRIDVVYSSDLARAHETAEILAGKLSIPLQSEPRLREIDVGDAVGLTVAELQERYPGMSGNDWFQIPFPRGESYKAMAKRTGLAARSIAAAHLGQSVALVSHGGAIRALIAELTGIHLDHLKGLVVANTSITVLHLPTPDSVARLRRLNDAAHLEPWAAVATVHATG